MKIEKLIHQSIEARGESAKELNAIRLFAGISDGIEGFFIDQFGPFILATIYNPDLFPELQKILKYLDEVRADSPILIKARASSEASGFFYQGNSTYLEELKVKAVEDDTHFEIRLNPKHDHGLYLDTKSSRRFVRENSKDKNVLNLFAYTCAFGIAAAKGGALSVTNVDPNKEYLEWGKVSADLNGINFKRYPDTTQDYLARHLRRLEAGKDKPYDLMIIDPPAFLVGRGSNRLSRNLWPLWLEQIKKSRCPELLFIVNDKNLARKTNLEQFIKEGLGESRKITSIPQSTDVIGQKLSLQEDRFYFTPAIYSVKST